MAATGPRLSSSIRGRIRSRSGLSRVATELERTRHVHAGTYVATNDPQSYTPACIVLVYHVYIAAARVCTY